jgi:hypothetical protein
MAERGGIYLFCPPPAEQVKEIMDELGVDEDEAVELKDAM